MSRITAGTAPDLGLDDDEPYQGVLVYAKVVKAKTEGWADQVEVEWELRQGAKLRDWVSVAVGERKDGTVAKLRQMLNALAEKPKDAELWFDPDELTWGYDLDGDDTTPAYAVLRPGLVVKFVGENREINGTNRYKITGYRSPAGNKRK